MAEHDEFLPHKDGVKKEMHFTDVSAFKLRRTSENVEVPDWFAVSQMGEKKKSKYYWLDL